MTTALVVLSRDDGMAKPPGGALWGRAPSGRDLGVKLCCRDWLGGSSSPDPSSLPFSSSGRLAGRTARCLTDLDLLPFRVAAPSRFLCFGCFPFFCFFFSLSVASSSSLCSFLGPGS
jgi:hypothetical protein